MAYTLDQLEAMGAKPVTSSTATAPTTPKKSYTPQELQSLGAKPVSLKVPEPPKKSDGGAGLLDAVFGFGKVGEAIGTKIAESRYNPETDPRVVQLSPEAKAKQREMGLSTRDNVDFEGPSGGQIAGSVAQGLFNFTPVGRIAKGIGTVAKGIGAGQKLAKGVGVVGAGAGTGYGYDVATGVAQGEADPLAPGAGTAVGAAIPLVPPILRGTGRAIGEGLGVTTGTGYGTIKAGLGAASKGGAEADAFRSALRGDVTPEQIVDDARSALGTVISDRTKAYRSQLEKLKTNANEFDTNPVIQKFNKQLEDFGVSFTDDGLPDFSRSPGLQRYEKDLYNMSMVLKNWGTKAGDNTVLGIDKLKQVLDDFRIGSRDSQKFDSFVTALRNEAKNLIKNEPGYDKLVKDYEQSTGLIKEIQRGLSLGDKAQTDTAFRKLTTTLRTNNEFRKQLVDELDAVTGGVLTPKIAGQQLSELLPRGLARIATGALGAGGIATGVGIVPILKAVLLTSPRLVGELLNAIGYTSSKIRKLFEVIAPKGMQFPGDMLLDTKGGQKLERSLIASAKNPSLGLAIKKSVTPKSVAEKMDREDFNKVVQIIDSPELRYSPEYERIVGDMGLIRATDEELVSFLKEAVDEFDGVAQRPVLKTAKELGADMKLMAEAKKYKSAEEFVENQMSRSEGMQHRPTFTMATAADVSQKASDFGLPDFYKNPKMYGTGNAKADNQSIEALLKVKNKPDAEVTIYRASPKNELRDGDWVTLSREYAQGESLAENTPVHSFKVKAKDIQFAGDSINEFGYFPSSKVEELTEVWKKATRNGVDVEDNYLTYLRKNLEKYQTKDDWINAMRASGKTKSQLTDIWNKAKSGEAKASTVGKDTSLKVPKKVPTGTPDPALRTKREVSAKTVSGEKFTVPSGTVLKPMVDGAKVTIEVGGKTYTIPKNQYQNLVGQSDRATATPFAPELKDTVETVLGVDEKQLLARKRAGEDVNVHTTSGTTKYSQYTLDGGENYREILIQAPASPKIKAQYIVENKPELKRPWVARFPHEAQHATSFETKAEADAWVKRMGEFDAPTEKEYRSSHWSEPNVISHIRMNERTVDGKKYAFMEELQSDWARDGRDKGFDQGMSLEEGRKLLPKGWKTIPGDTWKVVDEEGKTVASKLDNADKAFGGTEAVAIGRAIGEPSLMGDYKPGVPNNPLLKNWQIPTTKRALIEAVDSGADRFAWINGEQTSARYNLATYLDDVKWNKSDNNKLADYKRVDLNVKGKEPIKLYVSKEGTTYDDIGIPKEMRGKKLDEVLGKGLADKIMEKPDGTLSGEGLSFGGEWAKNLYDRQVRDIVKKLTGAEVKTVDMGLGSGAKVKQWASEEFGTKLTYKQMENEGVGLVIRPIEGGQNYVVTDLLGDGKFKAVPKSAYFAEVYDPAIGIENTYKKARPDSELTQFKETFDISTPTAVQQYIELTPEVKAKIQSKAPSFKMKTPSVADGIPLLLLMFGAASASQASE